MSEKNDELTDGQTERPTDNGDFIGPSVGRGPIKDLIIQHVTSNVNFI